MALRRQFLLPGDRIEPGPPVYCHAETPRGGRHCEGFVGLPPIGAVLDRVLELGEGEILDRVEDDRAAFRCAGCGRIHIYRCRVARPDVA